MMAQTRGFDQPYVPEWEDPQAGIKGETEHERRAYFKAHEVRSSCVFALRYGTDTPQDILDGWAALFVDIGNADERETIGHRRRATELRNCWRLWMAGQRYEVPEYEGVKRPKAIKAVKTCPHCGGEL